MPFEFKDPMFRMLAEWMVLIIMIDMNIITILYI